MATHAPVPPLPHGGAPPAFRRHGAGRALLRSVVTWAERRGVRWLQWQASAPALPFYARLGLTGDANSDPGHPFFEIDFAHRHPL